MKSQNRDKPCNTYNNESFEIVKSFEIMKEFPQIIDGMNVLRIAWRSEKQHIMQLRKCSLVVE